MIEYCMICGFVLIQIHSYEYILVQCMHNHFVIEATGGLCVGPIGLWALIIVITFPPYTTRCLKHVRNVTPRTRPKTCLKQT